MHYAHCYTYADSFHSESLYKHVEECSGRTHRIAHAGLEQMCIPTVNVCNKHAKCWDCKCGHTEYNPLRYEYRDFPATSSCFIMLCRRCHSEYQPPKRGTCTIQ